MKPRTPQQFYKELGAKGLALRKQPIHTKKELETIDTLDPVPRTMIESASDDDDAADTGDPADTTLQ